MAKIGDSIICIVVVDRNGEIPTSLPGEGGKEMPSTLFIVNEAILKNPESAIDVANNYAKYLRLGDQMKVYEFKNRKELWSIIGVG